MILPESDEKWFSPTGLKSVHGPLTAVLSSSGAHIVHRLLHALESDLYGMLSRQVHVHFAVEKGTEPLARNMAGLQSSYTRLTRCASKTPLRTPGLERASNDADDEEP